MLFLIFTIVGIKNIIYGLLGTEFLKEKKFIIYRGRD